jgi:TIR domain
MCNPKIAQVFVSYSHRDKALVTSIVHLLRAIGGTVFQDADSIPPGKRWRLIIEESIDHATTVLVFWCAHARESDAVREEWQLAVKQNMEIFETLPEWGTGGTEPWSSATSDEFRYNFHKKLLAEAVPDMGIELSEATLARLYASDGLTNAARIELLLDALVQASLIPPEDVRNTLTYAVRLFSGSRGQG